VFRVRISCHLYFQRRAKSLVSAKGVATANGRWLRDVKLQQAVYPHSPRGRYKHIWLQAARCQTADGWGTDLVSLLETLRACPALRVLTYGHLQNYLQKSSGMNNSDLVCLLRVSECLRLPGVGREGGTGGLCSCACTRGEGALAEGGAPLATARYEYMNISPFSHHCYVRKKDCAEGKAAET